MLVLKFKHLILSSLFLFMLANSSVYAAVALDYDTEPFNVLSPYAVSDNNVTAGTSKAYRAWFENGAFTGDLIEYNISSEGVLSTSVDFSVYPPTNTAGTNWSARIQFRAKGLDYWNATRKIIFHNGSVQKAFRWDNLSESQQDDLDGDENVLKFIRGDQSKETDKTNGIFRQRVDLLGDIIHSNPVYVAAPDSPFELLPGYSAFRSNLSTADTAGHADRKGRVYVGSNDGMLHAFNAETGNEVWAYIPSMILGGLDKLSDDPAESHRYFVDGQLNEGDADFETDTDPSVHDWHSLLVGGLGSGGKGLFALDITSADLSTETAYSGTDKKVLFEIDDSDDDIGHIHGKITIARLHNNSWALITGNGYDSVDKKAKLLLIDKDGNVVKVDTNDTSNNGLSTPTLVDADGDNDVDFAYAGDLQGNMWKFNFTSETVTSELLFSGSANKPITTAPDVRIHPFGGRLVYFGTGSLLSTTDATYKTTNQSIYAIWDGVSNPDSKTILTQTLANDVYNYTIAGDGNNAGYDITYNVRTSSNNTVSWAIHKGWQVDLSPGERVVSTPIIRADRLQLTTHNPTSTGGADAWLLELNYLNGGSGANPFLDLNNDTVLNTTDKVGIDTNSSKIPVGIHLGKGSFSGPTIARISYSRDTKFVNALLFSNPEPCTENCSGGFEAGHIDVDTDSPFGGDVAELESDSYCFVDGERTKLVTVDGVESEVINDAHGTPYVRSGETKDGFGGETDGHHHEYDKTHKQVYVDYINLEPLCDSHNKKPKLNRVTEAKIPYAKKFFVVLANADLSPGSTFQIADQEWNVVEYQKMIQQKLDAWITAGKVTLAESDNSFEKMMKDGDDSLLFSIDEIKASTKKIFRHAFNDAAIIKGGLVPTETGCVKKHPNSNFNGDSSVRNTGRWRGGALVTHVIDVEQYKLNTDLLQYQNPTDLYRSRTVKSGGSNITIALKEDTNNDGSYDKFYGGIIAKPIATTTTVTTTRRHHGEDITETEEVTTISNAAFLYESTLFWHNGANKCYGSDDWNASVVQAAIDNTDPDLKNTVASLESDLELIEIALASGTYTGEVLERMRTIKAKIEFEIKKIKDTYSSDGNSLEYTGTVAPPTNGSGNSTHTLGPNFRSGQRTWIDLTP